MGPQGRREDSTPRAWKRDRSGSQATVEHRRPRRYDDTTTSPRGVHGVKRETVVVPPTQRHEGPSIRLWLEASGPPQNPGVGFLSKDPTTYGAQAEVKKWREFLKGLRDDPIDLATLLNEDGQRQVDWWREYFRSGADGRAASVKTRD
jgi:hypothetical protein